ncbi:expressed unknown protein [Seminavis robusta]|uniref:Heterokaryon incompatibility domain-containing protein n=1 Tax=Seminavis robusta TaxID=568900 RepID=A0A9N8DQK2_9STRA|nr:expressed unknown protein [Seminavis robusta]|eukprot:Sro213_g088340.1 n/a (595) ;mRNA; r:16317-18101
MGKKPKDKCTSWLTGELAQFCRQTPDLSQSCVLAMHKIDDDPLATTMQQHDMSFCEAREGYNGCNTAETISRHLIRFAVEKFDLHSIISDAFSWYVDDEHRNVRLTTILNTFVDHLLSQQDEPNLTTTHQRCSRLDDDDDDDTEYLPSVRLPREGLPVTFLTLHSALARSNPPKYGLIRVRSEKETQMHAKVFVSHTWAAPDNPNTGDDWKNMVLFLSTLLEKAFLACDCLLCSGFPLDEVLDELVMHQDDGFLSDLSVTGTSNSNNRNGSTIARVSAPIKMQFVRLAADELSQWRSESATRDQDMFLQCFERATKRIWLWYDYCCIPQKPRQSTLETALFKRTLRKLPQIQRSMSTFSINSTEAFFGRAWCLAEWITAGHHECSIWNKDMTHFPGMQTGSIGESMMRTHKESLAVLGLLDPCNSYRTVLKMLDAAFTDYEHTENTNIVCWILWNAMFRSPMPWDMTLMSSSTKNEHQELMIGFGRPLQVIDWLQMVTQSWDQCNQSSFTYDFDAWHNARGLAAASLETAYADDKTEITEIVVPLDKDLVGIDFAAWKEAIDTAITEVKAEAADNPNEPLAVYVLLESELVQTG